jgi:trehalose 6-phosphate synthase/phosphatase
MTNPRVIVVSNRLPVNIAEEGGKLVLKRSLGGLATALDSASKNQPMLWIGWPGTWRRLTKQQLTSLNFPDLLVPVVISKRLLTSYYNHVANGVLWPLFHGMVPAKLDILADWKATKHAVNLFADAVVANLQESDVIWVHDYHLVLLPDVLRQRKVRNRIGFFLHTPFPPPKVFMGWKQHRRILTSLTKVDVLGFQTKKDVRHFKASLTQAGMELPPGQVVKAFPIGIDYKAFRTDNGLYRLAGYLPNRTQLNLRGRKLILSVSRLDYTKGIIQQLLAVEEAYNRHPAKRITYRLVVAPSREDLEEYQKLRTQIEDTVTQINGRLKSRYNDEPISFEYRSHGFEELNAWYRLADILLVTPIIDGMNLVVKEYIAARGSKLGSVVLSKTIGAAAQLKSAILVDPSSTNDIAGGITKALEMSLAERAVSWQDLLRNVREEDVFWWTNSFLDELFEKASAPRISKSETKTVSGYTK